MRGTISSTFLYFIFLPNGRSSRYNHTWLVVHSILQGLTCSNSIGLLAEKTLRAKCSAGMYNFSPKARNMRRRLDALESLLIEAYSLPRRDPRTVTVRSRMSDSIQEFTLHAFQVEGYRCRLPFIRLFFSIVLPSKPPCIFSGQSDSVSRRQRQTFVSRGSFHTRMGLFSSTRSAGARR